MRHFGSMIGLITGCCLFCGSSQAMAQAPGILAQVAEPEEQNFLVWLMQCLGLFGMLAVLAAIVLFFGSWIVVFAARRPAVIASYFIFLLLPPLLGVTAALKAIVDVFSVFAMSDTEVKQKVFTAMFAEVLVVPLTALLLTIPTFFILATGLFIRTLMAGSQSTTGNKPAEVPSR